MTSHGDTSAVDGEILRTLCGSGVHGLAIEGTDDRDEMGVYIERPDQLLGLSKAKGSFVSRTQPDGARSGPGDLDLVLYSLRKFMDLAMQGNPTVLTVLYAPAGEVLIETPHGTLLRSAGVVDMIVSRNVGPRFLGYLDSQFARLTGFKSQRKMPNRPELIERYGYDVKYASHAYRLGLQGIELLRTGRLTLPMPDEDREAVLAMKRGEFTYDDAVHRIEAIRSFLAALVDHRGGSPLRESPDRDGLNALLVAAHRDHWTERGL